MKTIPLLIVSAITSTQSQFYAVTTEIGMPNLEENLRYAVQQEQVCLTRDALYHRFPILSHPALANCRLGDSAENSFGTQFPLVCDNNHGTTGSALWTTYGVRTTGTLSIRLGGKNMTLWQRVTATARGPCRPPT
jgi:hypothetical protein